MFGTRYYIMWDKHVLSLFVLKIMCVNSIRKQYSVYAHGFYLVCSSFRMKVDEMSEFIFLIFNF